MGKAETWGNNEERAQPEPGRPRPGSDCVNPSNSMGLVAMECFLKQTFQSQNQPFNGRNRVNMRINDRAATTCRGESMTPLHLL